jgi:O-antigen ligase
MLLAPCGLAFYLWSTDHLRKWYLLATLVILAGLIGTQSRFAILVCALLCAAVVVASMIHARRLRAVSAEAPAIGKRAGLLVLWLIALLLLFVVLVPSVLERALARFGAAATTTPGGTILLRMTLWKAAIKVFLDHPLTGIGPGVFRYVDQYYGSLWFGSTYPFVRGLSAHNLFLHYLAESGIIGVLAMLSLFFNQFFHAVRVWRNSLITEKASHVTALVVVSSGLLFTAFLEGAWMWSATGFAASYFIAQIAIASRRELAPDRSYLPS